MTLRLPARRWEWTPQSSSPACLRPTRPPPPLSSAREGTRAREKTPPFGLCWFGYREGHTEGSEEKGTGGIEWDEWPPSFCCSVGEVLFGRSASLFWSLGKSFWSFRQVFVGRSESLFSGRCSKSLLPFLVAKSAVGFPHSRWMLGCLLLQHERAMLSVGVSEKSGSGRGATLVFLGRRRFFLCCCYGCCDTDLQSWEFAGVSYFIGGCGADVVV